MSTKTKRIPMWVQWSATGVLILVFLAAMLLIGQAMGVLVVGQGWIKLSWQVIFVSGTLFFISVLPAWAKIGSYKANWTWSGIAFAGLAGAIFGGKALLQSYGLGYYGAMIPLGGLSLLVSLCCLSEGIHRQAIQPPATSK